MGAGKHSSAASVVCIRNINSVLNYVCCTVHVMNLGIVLVLGRLPKRYDVVVDVVMVVGVVVTIFEKCPRLR